MITYNEGLVNLHILSPESEIPDDWISDNGFHYFQQGMDIFKVQNSALHSIILPAKSDVYENLVSDQKYSHSKAYLVRRAWQDFDFPIDQFKYVMRYFQWVNKEFRNEGAVLLLVHPELKEWKIFYVIQTGTGGLAVEYAHPTTSEHNDDRMINAIAKDANANKIQNELIETYDELMGQGWKLYGTIHSHCDCPAFHSGTDDADEANFDGLHITIGNVESGWSYSCRYMIGGVEFKTDIQDVLGITTDELEQEIENIDILDEHKELFIEDLFPAPPVSRILSTGKSSPYTSNLPWHNNNKNPRWHDWDNEIDQQDLWDQTEEEEELDFRDHVFYSNEMVVLADPDSGETIFVTRRYYEENYNEFVDYQEYMIEGTGMPDIIITNDGSHDSEDEWREAGEY